MKYRTPGQHGSLASFRERLAELDAAFDADEVLEGPRGPLGSPLEVCGRTLGNRFAVQPMEGWDATPKALPSELTLRRWRRFGRSTAKLVWGGEAFAVCEDGRANPNQLGLNPDADVATGLTRLLAELRAGHAEMGASTDDLVVGLQLTHSGRHACPHGTPTPRIAVHIPALDRRTGVAPQLPVLTDAELEAIGEAYVAAARMAQATGFDFVDVKACHGYLLHELLCARHRPGPYGGPLENRSRLLRRIIEDIRRECPGLAVGVRVSIADVFPHEPDPATRIGAPHGWDAHLPYEHGFGLDPEDPRRIDLTEPLELLGILREMDVRLVNLSMGTPYTTPHLQRPAAFPPSDGYLPPVDPLENVLDHLRATRACKAAFPDMILVGSGYSYLAEYLPHVAQHELRHGHVDVVGLGRMVLSYPELPADALAGRPLDRRRLCRTFSDCTSGPRAGMPSGCYPLDPVYRALPDAQQLRERKRRG